MKFRFQFALLAFIFAISLSDFSIAQISVEGSPMSNKTQLQSIVETITMPSFDLQKLLREDEFESQFKDIPPRFGKDFDVNFGIDNAGTFEILANGTKIWRLKIKSPGAMSINLIFDKFYLPKGSTFFVYSADKSQIYGAFTDANNQPTEVFSTTPCKGDEIILEYNAPMGLMNPKINVSKVVHAYKDIFHLMKLKDYAGSGPCNRNIVCPEGDPYRDNVARSVAVIIVNGTRNCTGSLLNNTRFDGTPYFMTANHCYDASVATWVFMFKYEAPSCPNPGGDGPLTYTISGCTLLAKNSPSDFCLVKLSSKPPASYNVYYTGWNRSNVPATNGTAVHHPDCDVKKISFYNIPNTPTSYNSPSVPGDSSHWHTTWALLPSTGLTPITEPGSSGSPLYDQNKRFIGQLHGGPSSCTASDKSDYYGKFDRSWTGAGTSSTAARFWLDSLNTGAFFIDGFDPNSGPLSNFSLQTPAAGVTVTSIPGSSATYTFNWDTASAAASYKWIFGSALPARLFSIPVAPKPFTLTLGQLDTYLAGIGLAPGDSISGSWDVWAFRNNAPQNDSLKSVNGPRTIKFKRTKPTLTAFSLVSPVSGTSLTTAGGSTTPAIFNWSKSGAGVTYKFYYASPNFSNLANIKFRMPASNNGFDTTLTTTLGDIDAAISSFVNMGDSTVGQWRCYAYNGTDSMSSTQTFNVTFKRSRLITVGTGTTSSNFPFTTYWKDGRTQYLYLASELGGSAGYITQIGFDVTSVGAPVMSDFKVSFKNTTLTSISTFETGGFTVAYNPTSYAPTTTGWNMITMTTPYYYTGGNLLIDICYNNTTYTSYSTVNSTAATGMYYGRYNDLTEPLGGCDYTAWTLSTGPPGRANTRFSFSTALGVSPVTTGILDKFSLSQNYPNPFNPVTRINFAVPKQSFVTLKVYDMLGREIKTLVNEIKTKGYYSVDFDGAEFASGVYFYRFETESFTDVKRMLLIK